MTNAFAEARRRQLVRLGDAKPPAPRAAMALAKSQAYQDAADSPATLRAYAADLANYKAWCERHGFVAMPAMPEVVGAYLAAAGEGYAMRFVARISRSRPRAAGGVINQSGWWLAYQSLSSGSARCIQSLPRPADRTESERIDADQ